MGKLLDTNEELLISSSNLGIKLIRPVKNKREINSLKNFTRVRDVLNLPTNVYFLNCDNIIQNINETTALTGGFSSVQSSIGRSIVMTATKETAKRILIDDAEVITSRKMKIFDESFVRRIDDTIFSALSFKFPWYNDNNQVIGLFGFSIVLNHNNVFELANCLELVIKLGLFDKYKCGVNFERIIPVEKLVEYIFLIKKLNAYASFCEE